MVKDRHKDRESAAESLHPILASVDGRIAEMAKSLAGEKLPEVLAHAQRSIEEGKQPTRALADALAQYKLV